ncbi:MFS transporter [Bacteroides difficilis]|uniref:MFS transporter n=1 Tax=Bacteroides difficilis TaxID=2763021 RepID=UPI003AAF9DF1
MKEKHILKILPVLFGFFIMGFCDVVGISTSYVKEDFGLSETLAGFIPSMVFIWFLLFSIPIATLMSKWGRKRVVQVGNIVTFIGMIIPFVSYNFITCMIAFLFLGFGNTILQVSLNPLLTNVVKGQALTSSLTAGQVVKAVSSFSGPFIAMFAVHYFGNWKYLFPIFACITLVSSLWLWKTQITEEKQKETDATIKSTFVLLKDKDILLLFLGIVFVVGVDVGMNTVTPKLLIERCSLSVDTAGLGASVYFFCRTIGAFIGAMLLAKISEGKFYLINVVIAAMGLLTLFFVGDEYLILTLVGVIGFTCSSIFPIIYSVAMQKVPAKVDEVSGLMITGVFGGAVIPPLMGLMTDILGSQKGSLLVIGASVSYLVFCAWRVNFISNIK